MSKFTDLIGAIAKWHPALLVLLVAFFALCFMLSVVLLVTGRGAPFGMLVSSVIGVAIFGKGVARKYAEELAQSKAEQDKLNS